MAFRILRAPSSTPTPTTPQTRTMVWVFQHQKLGPWSEFSFPWQRQSLRWSELWSALPSAEVRKKQRGRRKSIDILSWTFDDFQSICNHFSITVKFQSISIRFQSPSIMFNHFQSVWLSQTRRNLLTTGRWGKQHSAPGKWGRTEMGSDGFNRILTGLYLFSPVGVRLVPLRTHDFKGFWLDFNRILAGL